MVYAAIVAGGTGSRMGADIPKQFLPLGGKPVIIRTIEKFLGCRKTDFVYVGVHPDWTSRLAEMCAVNGLDTRKIRIVTGGEDRNSTVFRIIKAIRNKYGITENDIIVTHDGVRPFVSLREIEDSISAMKEYDGATVCAPVKDTILSSEGGKRIENVPDRSKLYRTLTPQTFKLSVLADCFEKLPPETVSSLTDTAGLLLAEGKQVGLVPGAEYNIKLTTPVDMRLGEILLGQESFTAEEQSALLKLIYRRRSYRGRYSPADIPREDLVKIMNAGLAAPSGCNVQTTSLIAVDDKAVLEKLRAVIDPPIAETAPAVICVLTQRKNAYHNKCYAVQDYSAAIENMLLAAEALGYRSCWYEGHITDEDRICDKIAEILEVPSSYELVCLLPVGKAESEPAAPSKKPFEHRAWFNGYMKIV